MLIGMGAAFLFFWIWNSSDVFIVNFVMFFVVFGTLTGALNVYHAFGFYATCQKCEHAGYWDDCPGFKEINKNLEKYDLSPVFRYRIKEDNKTD